MAGLYIHIPFCKQRCHYCDFHKSTSLKNLTEFLEALRTEIRLRAGFLKGEPLETIYIGGGTPSVLTEKQYMEIFSHIDVSFPITEKPEITFEANPEDLDELYLKQLQNSPVNRISIGVQSWCKKELKYLNRRHDDEQAVKAVCRAKEAGFSNISIDLIYGIPDTEPEQWEKNLKKTFSMDIQHLSAYHLTIEPSTVFGKRFDKEELIPAEEEESIRQMDLLLQMAGENGFQQYEISNFCKNGFYSLHNVNYWRQKKYLGLGPSAHSYDGFQREWNVNNNRIYILSLKNEVIPAARETLSYDEKYNEYIMTSLRTRWGIDLMRLEEQFQKEAKDFCMNLASRFIEYGMLEMHDNRHLILTRQGMRIADNIISELMMT